MQYVVLAGGLGTRVSSITQDKIPKCMIHIHGIPFIEYLINNLSSQFFNYKKPKILVSVAHFKEQIINHINNRYSKESMGGINIDFIDDGDVPLGTAGALRKAYDLGKLENKFGIIYGDSFLPIWFEPIIKFFNKRNQNYPALMTLFKNDNLYDKSNANLLKNGLVNYKNPIGSQFNYIDYGFSILRRDIIRDYIPENTKYNLSDLFTQLSKENRLLGYEVNERFYEIGSIEGIKDFTKFMK